MSTQETRVSSVRSPPSSSCCLRLFELSVLYFTFYRLEWHSYFCYPEIDYFPQTSRLEVFYRSYTTAIFQPIYLSTDVIAGTSDKSIIMDTSSIYYRHHVTKYDLIYTFYSFNATIKKQKKKQQHLHNNLIPVFMSLSFSFVFLEVDTE